MRAANDRTPGDDAEGSNGQLGQATETSVSVTTAPANPFAETFTAYWEAGWRSILPMPSKKKFPPPDGTTGAKAQPLSYPDLQAYADDGTRTNIALHMADGLIGLDVDAYDGKTGAQTLEQLQTELGVLPATFVSTARVGTPSGIRLFRGPVGQEYLTALPGIEILQAHHRYAMVWPSWNPKATATYVWIDETTGEILTAPPKPADIPELPAAWVARLRVDNKARADKSDLSHIEAAHVLLGLPKGQPCAHIKRAAGNAVTGEARHESYRNAQLAVLRLGRSGCPGAEPVLQRLRATFLAEMKATGEDLAARSNDWQRGLVGAAQIVATQPQGVGCPDIDDGPAQFSPRPGPTSAGDQNRSPEPATGARSLSLTAASSITPRRVRWCWHERMAMGALSLVAGPEGLGKSTFVYWLAAEVTQGRLPGEHLGTPKAVLIAATEDSWAHTVVPRLIAAGADLERVYRVDVTTTLGTDGALSLPADIPALGTAAQDVDAGLLVLDPLTSRLSAGLDTHKDSETRLALEPLVSFADRYSVAVVGIMHFNKSGGTDPLNLVMASKAFTAVARSVSTVIKDPDDDTEAARLFGTVKNNLGRSDLPTLRFTIGGHQIDTDDGEAWTSKLIWGADALGTISDALLRGGDSGDKSATAEAGDWLSDYLETQGGAADSADIKKAGQRAGHSQSTLRRAHKRLGLVTTTKGFPRRSEWSLPEGKPADTQSRHIPRGDESNELIELTGGKASAVSSVSSVESDGGDDELTAETLAVALVTTCTSCGVQTVTNPCRACQAVSA